MVSAEGPSSSGAQTATSTDDKLTHRVRQVTISDSDDDTSGPVCLTISGAGDSDDDNASPICVTISGSNSSVGTSQSETMAATSSATQPAVERNKRPRAPDMPRGDQRTAQVSWGRGDERIKGGARGGGEGRGRTAGGDERGRGMCQSVTGD